MKNWRFLLLLSALAASTPSFGEENTPFVSAITNLGGCGPTFNETLKKLVLDDDGVPAQARKALVDRLIEKDVPAYLKQTTHGDIPVILMNSDTAPAVDEFLRNSIGTQAQLQPAHTNDHGQFRLEKYVIDLADPGKRGFGELNSNGIAWKPMDSFLSIRSKKADRYEVIAEVAYALRPDEIEVARYYQRVRRTSIFRVPFVLDNNRSDMRLANTIQSVNASENCFYFCKSMKINQQIVEIEKNLRELGVPDVNAFFQDSNTQEFISQVKKKLLEVDPDNSLIMNDQITKPYLEKLKPYFKKIKDKRLVAVGNWVIGLDASLRYRLLLQKLKVSYDVAAEDINNPRATALLIYDDRSESGRFRDASYYFQGAGTARSGARVGGPDAWVSKTFDQKRLNYSQEVLKSPKFVRHLNRTYTEVEEVLTDDNVKISAGSRIITDADSSSPTIRNVTSIYHRSSNRGIIAGADGKFYVMGKSLYREPEALVLNKIHTLKKGSVVLAPPNILEEIEGVFANGMGDYRIYTKTQKLYDAGKISYEVGSANQFQPGMTLTTRPGDPITRIFFNGNQAQLLLKSGTLVPVN